MQNYNTKRFDNESKRARAAGPARRPASSWAAPAVLRDIRPKPCDSLTDYSTRNAPDTPRLRGLQRADAGT